MMIMAAVAKRNQSAASVLRPCCCRRFRGRMSSVISPRRRETAAAAMPSSFIIRQHANLTTTIPTRFVATAANFNDSASSFPSSSASSLPSSSGSSSSHRQQQQQQQQQNREGSSGGRFRDVETRARKLIQFTKGLILELDDEVDGTTTNKNKKNNHLPVDVVDRLLKDWNTTLKQLHKQQQQHSNSNPLLMNDSVEVIDAYVRKILSKKTLLSSDEVFAIYVGISAWARVASSGNASAAGTRADELFQLRRPHNVGISVSSAMARDVGLQKTYIRNRRDSYHALLLTWSRIASVRNRKGAERALYWLEQMKKEEKQLEENMLVIHRFIDIHCYNRVLAAFAACGDVEQVERLVEEEIRRRSYIRFNAVTYDCLIRAYQVQGRYPDRACEIFHQQLSKYRERRHAGTSSSSNVNSSLKPLPLTLGRVLSMYRTEPDQGKDILERALAFEEEYPECRGLVALRSFVSVIQSYTKQDRVEEAEDLLVRLFQLSEAGNGKLKPNRVVLGIVMDGYAQRQTPESVAKVEEMLNSIEDRVLRLDSANADVDCTAYNILMTSYLRTYEPSEVIRKIKNTIVRMDMMSKRHSKPDLCADSVSYTILMRALVNEGLPGFEYKVEDVLNMMIKTTKAGGVVEEAKGGIRPKLHCFAVALDAWARSEVSDPDEVVRSAERILDLIDYPDTTCYNIVANIYAKRGRPDKTIGVLNRMKSDYECGRNMLCRPDNITHSTVIHALCSSRTPGSWKVALATFDDMLSRLESGDASCKPTEETVTALLHLLKLTNDEEVSDKLHATRDVLERLERFNLRLGPAAAVAFIGACSETYGEQEHRRQALAIIIEVLQRFDSSRSADAAMYNAALEACHRLLLDYDDLDDEHCDTLAEIFKKCADAGQVNGLVLNTLREICPTDIYLRLTLQDARKTPNLDAIPDDWKRNIIPT